MIVGQGLAGTCLALELYSQGLSVVIVDNDHYQSASLVAAGLYNPITGRKMVKTWNADSIFGYLPKFYRKWEVELKSRFVFDMPIYRPFFSIEEQNEWMGKSSKDEFSSYIKNIHTQSISHQVSDPYGGVELCQSGYVNVSMLLRAARDYFVLNNMLENESISTEDLTLTDRGVRWKEFNATKCIFCNGVNAVENPYTKWLPFKPVKGEILNIKSEFNVENKIVNRGVFVIPDKNGQFRVGSNYDNNDLSWKTTKKGKEEILEKLDKLISCDYEVMDQIAGVRPASKDRRPIIGLHPEHETIGVFNGLGTKGVSLAPYYARQFVRYLQGAVKLDNEVNISRYFSLY